MEDKASFQLKMLVLLEKLQTAEKTDSSVTELEGRIKKRVPEFSVSDLERLVKQKQKDSAILRNLKALCTFSTNFSTAKTARNALEKVAKLSDLARSLFSFVFVDTLIALIDILKEEKSKTSNVDAVCNALIVKKPKYFETFLKKSFLIF